MFDEIEFVEEYIRILIQGHLDAQLDHILLIFIVQNDLNRFDGLLGVLFEYSCEYVDEDLGDSLLVADDLSGEINA